MQINGSHMTFRKFIKDLSLYDIINITNLFTEESSEKINRKYNTFGIDL